MAKKWHQWRTCAGSYQTGQGGRGFGLASFLHSTKNRHARHLARPGQGGYISRCESPQAAHYGADVKPAVGAVCLDECYTEKLDPGVNFSRNYSF